MRSPRYKKESDYQDYKHERNHKQSRESYITDNEMLPRQYESQDYQNTTIVNKINTTDEDEE